jgi:hypothetical protein
MIPKFKYLSQSILRNKKECISLIQSFATASPQPISECQAAILLLRESPDL